jgi:acyl-CoA synthetase (AMP-forming)/AMP-acid ligase II
MTPHAVNVAAHLGRMAHDHPEQVAIHAPRGGVNPDGPTEHRAVTFAELHADSDAIAHGLHAAGVHRGTRCALMVPPSPDFFALTFALLKLGAVPVLIDPGMGTNNLGKCIDEAEPAAFIGIAKAHAARRVLGWGRKTVRVTVNVGRWRLYCHHSLAELREKGRKRGPWTIPTPGDGEPAAILFTSGSTGPAKGVVYTHGIFAAQVDLLKSTYGIQPGEIDLCTFPLFALFGPALGMTCVIPDMDATRPAQLDPHKAASQIRQFGVTNTFGSPAVIRRLGELAASLPSPLAGEGGGRFGPPGEGARGDTNNAERPSQADAHPSPGSLAKPSEPPSPARGEGKNLSPLATLKRVISAGAPASAASIERFIRLLPDSAEVFTPYGATEALPVANIGSREILGETRHLTEQGKGVCVGRPVGGMEVRVIRISDEPIPEWSDALLAPPGEVGEFVVRGPVVTRQYYNKPDATKLAKIRDPHTGEVFHRMGDVGYTDDRGRLWFCGRKSHRVVTPHGTLFTDMVEPIFNTVPGVSRTALVGVKRDGVTHPVVLAEVDDHKSRELYGDHPQVRDTKGWQTDEAIWEVIAAALRELAQRFSHTKGIATFVFHDRFPVDVRHNSKIFREKLATETDKRLGPKWHPEATAEAGK